MELTPEQGRVLGSLVEKELTTPQGYPLTDNALLSACNQTTSRDPVVHYDTATVRMAVRELRELRLLRTVHRPGERSDKHRHELAAALDLSPAQVALLGVLLLRGPQTPAELRARTERMHPFGSTEQAEDELVRLMNREEPLVVRLERLPGRKEARYAQLLTGTAARSASPAASPSGDRTSDGRGPARPPAPGPDEVAGLRAEVVGLRAEIAALQAQLTALRTGAGGSAR